MKDVLFLCFMVLKIMVLLFGHWDAMWPLPRYLKHCMSLVRVCGVDTSFPKVLGVSTLDLSFKYYTPFLFYTLFWDKS